MLGDLRASVAVVREDWDGRGRLPFPRSGVRQKLRGVWAGGGDRDIGLDLGWGLEEVVMVVVVVVVVVVLVVALRRLRRLELLLHRACNHAACGRSWGGRSLQDMAA